MAQLPRVIRRRSAISGWGVYALHPIEEDTHIVEYKGELVRQAEAWRREQRYLPRQRIWIFNIDERWAREAAGPPDDDAERTSISLGWLVHALLSLKARIKRLVTRRSALLAPKPTARRAPTPVVTKRDRLEPQIDEAADEEEILAGMHGPIRVEAGRVDAIGDDTPALLGNAPEAG